MVIYFKKVGNRIEYHPT